MLVEDHFGDGGMWRVRWILTNCWGVYASEFWPPREVYIFGYILFLVYIFLQFSPTAGACTRVSFDRLANFAQSMHD